MRLIVVVLSSAAVLLGGLAGTASALPGDEPIVLLGPADGATVEPSGDGTRMTFTCPTYRTLDLGDGFAVFGAGTDHTAALATGPELGTDGRLRQDQRVDLAGPIPDDALPAGQCTTVLGDEDRRGLAPGTYWWQVSRICTGCAGSYESSEPRRIVVRADVRAALRPGSAPYAGYPTFWSVTATGAPDGSAVTVERRAGTGWKRVGVATVDAARAEPVLTLPRGRQRLRATVTVGTQATTTAEVAVRVRPDRGKRRTSARSDGRWAGTRKAPVTFRVADAGRRIRDLRATVTMVCPAVPAPGSVGGQITTQAGVALVPSARIAPDGRFVGVIARDGASGLVRGRLAGRALSDGHVQLRVGPCVGSVRFGARRADPQPRGGTCGSVAGASAAARFSSRTAAHSSSR